MGARVLYISYDGVLEPLGQSQILPYLCRLARDHEITLVSYEKPVDWRDVARRDAALAETMEARIRWRPLTYHKHPTSFATAYDLFLGFLLCSYLALRHRIQIVHARSYVSSVLALLLKRLFGTLFIFDMRGFWADERVDGGIWQKDSFFYRTAKRFERRFLMGADVIISLTFSGRSHILRFPYLSSRMPRIEVIPTCTNLEIFRPINFSRGLGRPDRPFTLGSVGTVGTWNLFDTLLECFKILREIDPHARLLIVNRAECNHIRERMKICGVPADWAEIKSVDHSDVPREIARMDAGIILRKPAISQVASAPTRLGEFLACGVPCLGNAGVGDMEQTLEGEGVGVVLKNFERGELEGAIRRLLLLARDPVIADRCVEVARRYFSLEQGVQKYDRIYQDLAKSSAGHYNLGTWKPGKSRRRGSC